MQAVKDLKKKKGRRKQLLLPSPWTADAQAAAPASSTHRPATGWSHEQCRNRSEQVGPQGQGAPPPPVRGPTPCGPSLPPSSLSFPGGTCGTWRFLGQGSTWSWSRSSGQSRRLPPRREAGGGTGAPTAATWGGSRPDGPLLP